MQLLTKAAKLQLVVVVAAFPLVFGGLAWLWGESHPGQYDAGAGSSDLKADVRLMWETAPLRRSSDSTVGANPHASTDRAINAASRVFNTVEFVGMNKKKVVALLGHPQLSSNSIYNFPFWPAPKETLVYRFDSGAYGWQFNLIIGEDGKVRRVERHWIH